MPIAQNRLEILQVCKLLQYVRDEDKVGIEKLVINGMPHIVNYNEPLEGNTALITAACANNEKMLEYLLYLGAHPDVMDFKGRSAIMRAAEYGHVQCMDLLAKAGADMRQQDLDGKSVLFYCIASTDRHSKCMDIVLQCGADVNNKTKDGRPVFLVACETAVENEESCLHILKARADPNSKHDASGKTALMAACGSGSVKVVREILDRGGDVNATDKRGRHAAHFAAKGGFFEVLVCLSAYGAQFDQYDLQGNNPIHLAADGHAMCCKFLGQRGCNPKPKNDDGFAPKVIAKDNGHKDCMKELKKVERSFGKTGKNNEPWAIALYDWANERAELIREMFLKFDPDETGMVQKDIFEEGLMNIQAPIDEEVLKKVTPLHDKARDGNINYEEFLTGKKYVNKQYLMSAFEGKKKKKKGGKGKKAKKFKLLMPVCTMEEGPRAADGGPPEMYIEQHLPFTDEGRYDRDHPPEHPLQDDSAWYLNNPDKTYVNINDAAKFADMDSLKLAIQRGTNVDTRDKYYKTPLMAACTVGNMESVKFLLDNGAYVNARDNFKWTPLHHACHAGQMDIVQLLLEHGAELDAVALNGGTPLVRAIEASRIDLVQFMIGRGAKIQTENRKGHNPMDVALSYADPRVIDVVAAKWESLPPPSDKKKGGKGGKKSAGKKKAAGEQLPALHCRPGTPSDDMTPRPRKGSILRAASALACGIDEQENITYVPRRAWTQQPTTEDLISKKVQRRDRFTYEIDFPDFEMPFKKNVTQKIVALGPEAE